MIKLAIKRNHHVTSRERGDHFPIWISWKRQTRRNCADAGLGIREAEFGTSNTALQLRANPKILAISSERSEGRRWERGGREGWKRRTVETRLRIQRPSSRRQGDKFQLSRFQTGHLFSHYSWLHPTWRSIAVNEIPQHDICADTTAELNFHSTIAAHGNRSSYFKC